MVIRVLDLETQNHPYYGLLASVHNPDNYVVEVGWQDFKENGEAITPVLSKRFESAEEANASDVFSLEGVDKLVVHNAQYELSWFLVRYYKYFHEFYVRGGRVCCTAMAEYLISAQSETYPSLNNTAVNYGGTHKVDGVKMLWQQGTLTADIDPDLLHEYLCGPSGDVENTARCFFGQRPVLAKRGSWKGYLVACDALVSYAMCEAAGLYVDMDLAKQHMVEIEQELADIEKEIRTKYLSDVPKDLEVSWRSTYHRSAFVYGGTVNYSTREKYDPPKYVKGDFYKVNGEFIPVGDEIPEGVERYVRGKNAGLPKVHRLDTDVEADRKVTKQYRFPGIIRISSLPEHLREYFNTNGHRTGKWVGAQTLPDGSPVYSTATDTLIPLSKVSKHSGALLSIIRQATLMKDLGTYYMKGGKGALHYVTDKGLIHPSINATATATTRLSMNNPNMQTLPRGDIDSSGKAKSRVKEMFVSRFGDDGRIGQVDYTGLEVVVAAAVTKDEALIKMLQEGVNMHTFYLAAKEGMDYKEIEAIREDHTHPDSQMWNQKRTEIKPVVFASQYGATAAGLVFSTGVSMEYAESFLDAMYKTFPTMIAFRQLVLDEVEKTAAVSVPCKEFVNDEWSVYKRGYWQSEGGLRFSWRQYPKFVEGKKVMSFKPTQIANYWNQGIAAEVMRTAMALLGRWLIKNDYFKTEEYPEGRVFLINNVHDAVYLDIHKDMATETLKTVKKIMEYAPKFMDKTLGYTLSFIEFPAVAEIGPNMSHGEIVK